MWNKDEIDEEYVPIALDWSDDDQQKLDIAIDVRNRCSTCWTQVLKRHNIDVYEWLMHRHPLLNEPWANTATKLYWLMHKLTFFPRCPVCGKTKYMHKNIDSFELGYYRACCKECAAANPARQKKIADTTEMHYGSRNFFTSTTGKEKIKKYLEKHGITNAFQLESIKEKSRKSRKKNFGYEYTMQSPDKRKMASQNYKEKTGYAHQFSDPAVIEKSKETRQKNIDAGIDPKCKFKKNWRIKRYHSISSLTDEVVPKFTLDEFMGFDRDSQYHVLFDWHCNKCGKDFLAYLDQNLIT